MDRLEERFRPVEFSLEKTVGPHPPGSSSAKLRMGKSQQGRLMGSSMGFHSKGSGRSGRDFGHAW